MYLLMDVVGRLEARSDANSLLAQTSKGLLAVTD